MSTITIRFKHLQSSTPITELQIEPTAKVAELRALLQERLASEERCLMRVFGRWHAELAFGALGGRRRLMELTEADEGETLASLGIGDYSEVQLEGPLTGDVEGVGQAVALLGHQVQRQSSQTNAILLRIADSLSKLAAVSERAEILNFIANEVTAYRSLCREEHFAYRQLQLLREAHEWRHQLNKESELEYAELLVQLMAGNYFTIDQTTPHQGVMFEDPYTAVKTANGNVTLRASQPLTPKFHKWAVKIKGGYTTAKSGTLLGMLPKLTPQQVAKMGSSYLGSKDIGGWGICGDGTNGDWQCDKFAFSQGDVVCFDFSFANKTLTISCGARRVVAHIPSIKDGEELYPAFYFYLKDYKLGFVALS